METRDDSTGEIISACDELEFFDGDDLIPADELPETFFLCPCCAYQYQLWFEIIERTGSAIYGHRAFAAFALDDYIANFKPKMQTIDAQGYRDVQAVRSERARLDAQRVYVREMEAKAQAAKQR